MRDRTKYYKEYYKKNSDKVNHRARGYRKRRKLLNLSWVIWSRFKVKISPIQLWGVLKKQRLRCALSGQKLTIDNISIDHIIPLNDGGSTALANIRFVTKDANKAKGILSDAELLSLCKNIVTTLTSD